MIYTGQEFKDYKKEIEEKLNEIKDTNDENKKCEFYEDILSIDNTSKEYFLFLLNTSPKNKNKNEFEKGSNEYEICLPNKNYK